MNEQANPIDVLTQLRTTYCSAESYAAIAELIEAAVLVEESLSDDNRLAVRLRAALANVGGA